MDYLIFVIDDDIPCTGYYNIVAALLPEIAEIRKLKNLYHIGEVSGWGPKQCNDFNFALKAFGDNHQYTDGFYTTIDPCGSNAQTEVIVFHIT